MLASGSQATACLTLNKNKCEFVLFKRRNKIETIEDIGICIDDVILNRQSCTKDLGIFIDESVVGCSYKLLILHSYMQMLFRDQPVGIS